MLKFEFLLQINIVFLVSLISHYWYLPSLSTPDAVDVTTCAVSLETNIIIIVYGLKKTTKKSLFS